MKSLRLAHGAYVIHAADMKDGVAVLFADHVHLLPPAAPPDAFVHALDALCRQHCMDVVIPCNEAEIRSLGGLASHPLLPCGTRIVSQTPFFTARHGDKLECCRFLQGKVPLADFCDAEDHSQVADFLARHGFPMVLKERSSYGQRGVAVIRDAAEFAMRRSHFHNPLLQTFLEGDDQEYTVGVFCHGSDIRMICFRRRLDNMGCSWFATLDQPPLVLDYCHQIARAVNTQGSFNIQLRLTAAGPRLLEINTRFSSLAAARAACGFNDVEWSVLQTLGRNVPERLPPPPRFEYQRYIAEVIRTEGEFHVPSEWLPRQNISRACLE
jgi:carbamoyl-phosphate synthase large subunit